MDMETEEKAVVEIPVQDTMDFKTKVIYNKDKKKSTQQLYFWVFIGRYPKH